jgi:protein-disulfide isomerase
MTEAHDIDGALDALGAEQAVLALADRIRALRPAPARFSPDGRALLTPPLSGARDHVDGPEWAAASLVVFGAYGTPAARRLGQLLERLRQAHPASLCVAWRHLPDPDARTNATGLALAAEAAATGARFWAMTRALLELRHDDPRDLHAAARRAGVDFDRLLALMRAGAGADRVVHDVESAFASGVTSSPALFVNGERFGGELDADAVWAALEASARG